MKRYAIDVFMNSALTPEPFADVEMVSDADGDWVRHEEAQSEIDRLRAENERLKMLCHSYYQAYTHNDAEGNDCTELWMQGAAVDGELRERPNA